MEERIIDDEYARGIRLKKTKDGYAINGGANAGILAAKILATSDEQLLERLKNYTKELKESVQAKDARLQEVGYKNY